MAIILSLGMRMSKYVQQGKSENYQHAEDRQLLKAGEVASLLSKKFNTKIAAAELAPFAGEWHHAGVFKQGSGLKGRRIYFFKPSDIEKITLEKILANRKKVPDTRPVQGWFTQYFKMTDPATRRRINKAFVGIYSGPASKAPKGFTVLSPEDFTKAETLRGTELTRLKEDQRNLLQMH